eukprot:TRINITY_DN7955_c1_g1_i1.p1 TRINITY_DN7955_c1_g1~~TRINITY_DN7955_c1_g1_i1.p1  ORF type:complete len:161 (-),score=8.04 TRINITY_DN7955_c1_g1_i1:75-557(-)
MKNVETFLTEKEIDYTLYEHVAVYTCEEIKEHCGNLPGVVAKNLFLKNRKGTRYFLVVLPADKQANIKKIGAFLGAKDLTFVNAETLYEKLQLEPGAVSPFGLLNDLNAEIELCLDRALTLPEALCFHPNRNTASLVIAQTMFQKFLTTLNHKIHLLDEV